jgi:hypothetical protein
MTINSFAKHNKANHHSFVSHVTSTVKKKTKTVANDNLGHGVEHANK